MISPQKISFTPKYDNLRSFLSTFCYALPSLPKMQFVVGVRDPHSLGQVSRLKPDGDFDYFDDDDDNNNHVDLLSKRRLSA